MAHLWIKDETDGWCVMPLDAQVFALSQSPPHRMRDPDESVSSALLVQQTSASPSRWLLISHPGDNVRVNGNTTTLGVRVLTDRDEISVEGVGAFFFSTESLAQIESFPGSAQKIFCPRCRQVLDEGVAAVKCPQCGVWYHETEELNCWRYTETCALCPQSTELDAGFRWTPEEL